MIIEIEGALPVTNQDHMEVLAKEITRRLAERRAYIGGLKAGERNHPASGQDFKPQFEFDQPLEHLCTMLGHTLRHAQAMGEW